MLTSSLRMTPVALLGATQTAQLKFYFVGTSTKLLDN